MKRIVFLIVSVIVIMAAFAVSAATTFTAHAPEKVAVGNAFNVVFVLENGSGSGLQTPTVSGLKLLFGPDRRFYSHAARFVCQVPLPQWLGLRPI